MTFDIRCERPSDIAAIAALTAAAFLDAPHSSHTEHFIVDALREAGRLSVSLVAVEGGSVIGHVALSPVLIDGRDQEWFGLGPLAVAPVRQRQGIGSALAAHALGRLEASGAAGCVVLGDPAYYGRFGFSATPALVLPGVPAPYFQALKFRGAMPAGIVSFDDAFNARG
ncbi:MULTISPECIES: N-acetyltransferase [unclassified Caballeronia]|uniref:GNAT family N-acetyltransferase n=1 Tax=unclassified Caballeronia TaxID=2646786 RepID=UPI002856445B|nr:MULTISPECIES: N-acetyltransferase [unclassified Caballeronia]MDR5739428.1 N-acetyltransferase [Caballeronia sp. LZ016]MDR5807917.1 N-acetyltransferase [Caballeronia sp. LZ019]